MAPAGAKQIAAFFSPFHELLNKKKKPKEKKKEKELFWFKQQKLFLGGLNPLHT